jgi:DNA-binding MurR/RpiR family transcriptional regulator
MLERIRSHLPAFTAAERKVADLVLSQPYSTLQAAVAEIAASAGVSQPTVIRFCRSLGCSGLPDFKLKMAASLVSGVPYVHSCVLPEDPTSEIAAKVFDNTVSALLKCRNEVNHCCRARDASSSMAWAIPASLPATPSTNFFVLACPPWLMPTAISRIWRPRC